MFEKNVFPTWGEFKLKDITRLDYQSWITKYAKTKRYSKNYMRLLNGLVAGVFTDAVLNDVISKSPIQKIKVSGSPSRDTSITRSEFNTVFNFIKDSERLTLQQRTMALLTLIGLRHEEIMGIRVKYVKQNMLGILKLSIYMDKFPHQKPPHQIVGSQCRRLLKNTYSDALNSRSWYMHLTT